MDQAIYEKIVEKIDPDAYTASTVLSGALDTLDCDEVEALIMAGTLGSSATLDAKLVECDTSGGTYTDVTGAAIMQLTQAGTDESDSVASITVTRGKGAWTKRYVKLSMTIAVATSDAGGIITGLKRGLKPLALASSGLAERVAA